MVLARREEMREEVKSPSRFEVISSGGGNKMNSSLESFRFQTLATKLAHSSRYSAIPLACQGQHNERFEERRATRCIPLKSYIAPPRFSIPRPHPFPAVHSHIKPRIAQSFTSLYVRGEAELVKNTKPKGEEYDD
jgi:hypothetical protein